MLVGKLQGFIWHLARCILGLQEYNLTVMLKSGRKPGDADRLSQAPVEPAPAISDDDKDVLLSAIDSSMMGRRQRTDPEIRAVLNYIKNQGDNVPQDSSLCLHDCCVPGGVLRKKNFTVANRDEETCLFAVPDDLWKEIPYAFCDEKIGGLMGQSRMLNRDKKSTSGKGTLIWLATT